jgi:hypothetical protein
VLTTRASPLAEVRLAGGIVKNGNVVGGNPNVVQSLGSAHATYAT